MVRLPILLFLAALVTAPVVGVADEVVDLNTADAATLARVLVGVGKAKAEAIVAHRDQFGPFTDVDELQYVKGIGAATIETNRTRMTVGADGPASIDSATIAER